MGNLDAGVDVGRVVQERTGIAPASIREANFGKITTFTDASRLYEFTNDSQLRLYLTPEGIAKKRSIPVSERNTMLRTGSFGEGELLERNRSEIRLYPAIEVVEKKSIGSPEDEGYQKVRRLMEMVTMRNIGKQVADIQTRERLRLETPVYYGFASWVNTGGQYEQAIFMSQIHEQNLDTMEPQAADAVIPDLEQVLSQAREAGVTFLDLTSNNIYVRNEPEGNTYIIADQS